MLQGFRAVRIGNRLDRCVGQQVRKVTDRSKDAVVEVGIHFNHLASNFRPKPAHGFEWCFPCLFIRGQHKAFSGKQ